MDLISSYPRPIDECIDGCELCLIQLVSIMFDSPI